MKEPLFTCINSFLPSKPLFSGENDVRTVCSPTSPALRRSVSGVLFVIAFLGIVTSSTACTVFLLTNGVQTHFFNNEDFTNPKTRIWFIPKGRGHFGCAYVGFANGEPQGGINTEGLAFDWVTVDNDSYVTDPAYTPEKHLVRLKGNSCQWMLEQCRTVDEAVKFYQTYREPAFARTTLIIADKSGASVVIGSKNGKLYFERSKKSRGLGYGEATFNELYKAEKSTNITTGAEILKQCVAPGDGGTKYSNSYNLNNGDIIFYNFNDLKGNTKLNLLEELKKGGHYYEPSLIASQIQQPLRSLMLNMNRHILFKYTPLPDQEAAVTAKIWNMFSEVANGELQHEDLSENLKNELKKDEAGIKAVFGRFGKLTSADLIYKGKSNEYRDYSYIMKFEKVTILWQFLLNDGNKIHDFNTLSVSWNQ